tara:strand:+ start:30 stop:503 length:474 start_codon:yes stop_codon:yes gene_type:complete
MSFSKLFCNKTPFKNKSEEAKTQENVEQKPLYSEADWHKVASVTDAAIKKGAGAYIEVPNPNKNKQEGEGSVAKMSPLNGAYESGVDIGATYIPTASLYTDMFAKIGKAVADIDANKKKKDKEKEFYAKYGDLPTDSKEYRDAYNKTFGIIKPTYKV